MSAITSKTDADQSVLGVRFVPITDITGHRTNAISLGRHVFAKKGSSGL